MADLATQLRDALRHGRTLPPPQRLEITVVEQGIRVQVSAMGARQVGCVVPWNATQLQETLPARSGPILESIDRCSAELIRRYSVPLETQV